MLIFSRVSKIRKKDIYCCDNNSMPPRVLIYNNFRLDRNNRMAGMMMKMMNPMGSMPVSQHSIRTQYGGDNHFPALKNIRIR